MPTEVKSQIVTADQLFLQPSDGYRYELRKGNLVMMSPAGGRHGRVTNRIAWLLSSHVESRKLGEVFAAETGFLLESNPDTVLAGDVAFVAKDRLRTVVDESRFLPFAPDVIVEVLSPNDSLSRAEAKALLWIDSGCRLVLLVDPDAEVVHASSAGKDSVVSTRRRLEVSDVVDGWTVAVADFFARSWRDEGDEKP